MNAEGQLVRLQVRVRLWITEAYPDQAPIPYVLPGDGGGADDPGASAKSGRAGADLLRKDSNIEVQLDPKDLESDEAMQAALKKKFEDAQATEAAKREREDLSGMVADEAGRLTKKRKAAEKKKEGKQYKNVF